MELTGYVRSDGRVGFRNLVAVIPLAGCAQEVARRVADQVPDAVALSQPLGCDLGGPDKERLTTVLYQLATHPNVGGAVFITLGCAATNAHRIPQRTEDTGRPTEIINVQLVGGTNTCVAAGVEAAERIAETIKKQQRVDVPISSIVLGTKCGASDETSYEVCNPALGTCCDMLVDAGGTVVLSEDMELVSSIDALAERAVDAETKDRLYEMVKRLVANFESRWETTAQEIWPDEAAARKMSLNRAGKAGSRPINKVVRLGELIDSSGLVVLDGPNSDLISITSMTAAGCNLLAFTTGRGTLIASPLAPTIKITANEKTFARMKDNIDFLATAEHCSDANELFDAVVACANGKPTKGELAGHGEMFIPLEGVTF